MPIYTVTLRQVVHETIHLNIEAANAAAASAHVEQHADDYADDFDPATCCAGVMERCVESISPAPSICIVHDTATED